MDQGQADILVKLSALSQELTHADERAASRLTLMGDQILGDQSSSTAQDDTQFDNLQGQLSALEAQVSGVQTRMLNLSQSIGDLGQLKKSISTLIDIERQNLNTLFA